MPHDLDPDALAAAVRAACLTAFRDCRAPACSCGLSGQVKAAIRAYIAAEWQPIATAPEGIKVLLHAEKSNETWSARYHPALGGWRGDDHFAPVTHWRPLYGPLKDALDAP